MKELDELREKTENSPFFSKHPPPILTQFVRSHSKVNCSLTPLPLLEASSRSPTCSFSHRPAEECWGGPDSHAHQRGHPPQHRGHLGQDHHGWCGGHRQHPHQGAPSHQQGGGGGLERPPPPEQFHYNDNVPVGGEFDDRVGGWDREGERMWDGWKGDGERGWPGEKGWEGRRLKHWQDEETHGP